MDVQIPGALGALTFKRFYTSNPQTWLTDEPLVGVPKPFGASLADADSVEWWHEYLSLVRLNGNVWSVWRPGGGVSHFDACSGTPCIAQPHWSNSSISERLQRTAQGFVLKSGSGESLYFEAPFVSAGATQADRFFLTEMKNAAGITRLSLGYAPPAVSVSCPVGDTGTGFGVPYLSMVESAGSTLTFGYSGMSPAGGGVECVIDRVDLVAPGQAAANVVQYAYASDGVAVRPGRIAAALWPSRSESYDYASGQLIQLSSDGKSVVHTQGADGGVVASVTTGEQISISGYESWGTCQPGSNCCGSVPMRRTVAMESAGRGDGTDGGSGFVRTYEFISELRGGGAPRLYRTVDSCSVGRYCSAGTTQVEWECGTSTSPGYEKARKDKRGNWEVYSYEVPDAGMPAEKIAEYKGASSMAGSDALEEETFQYIDGAQGERLLAASEKPSTLGGTGARARTTHQYDSATNRMRSTIRSGWTRVRNASGAWTTQQRFIGTFYFTSRVSAGDLVSDPLGRTLEVHGPCFVNSESATDCSPGEYPLTQYHYWSSTETSPRKNRLKAVYKYPTLASAPLVTTYEQYDAWGNATEIVDANGVGTFLVYDESRLVSSRTGSGGTTYFGYDNGRQSWVHHPAGNYDVFCYRTGTVGEACAGGEVTDQLQWKARSADSSGAAWTEKVEYVYWPDGTVRQERFISASTSGPEIRRIQQYAADAHRRPTWQGWGVGPGSYNQVRLFDGADNLVGIGHPRNNPPAQCSGIGGTTGLPLANSCVGLAYDRANRLTHVDENRASAAWRTCFGYDAQGNTTSVRTGCPTSSSCAACMEPESVYVFDDFGGIVEVSLPHAEGPLRSQYDALGNVVLKETEVMRSAGEAIEYAYDSMSRLMEVKRLYTSPSVGSELLYALRYDTWGSVDASCVQPQLTLGRLRARVDSFGTTWYRYDDAGRVVAEIRLRTGETSCSDESPHTLYQYTANGDVRQIRYPRGRTVSYAYGTGAAANRIDAIDVALFDGASWSSSRLVSNVLWEPFGGLRGYQLHHLTGASLSGVEYMLGDNSSVAPSSSARCSALPPLIEDSDKTGRLRSLRVSSGALSKGQGTGDIYKRTYTWQKDQVSRIDTCVLGATGAKSQTFTYDAALRLLSAGGSSNAYSYSNRTYAYSPRGNQSYVGHDQNHTLAMTYGASPLTDRLLGRTYSSDDTLAEEYMYDSDGRVLEKRFGRLSASSPIRPWIEFAYGQSAEVATDTVFRSVVVNGLAYNYYYDALGRRRSKVYPTGARDEYFYDLEKRLLSDQGSDSASVPVGYFVEDDYVWLDGRPVVLVRGRFAADWTRDADSSTACARNGEAASCGVYFPVTDHIGMPVLMLDASRQITGLGEHEPYGHVNRKSIARGTAHPYGHGSNTQMAQCNQPVSATVNPSTDVRVRFRFGLVDTESNSGTPVDYALVRQAPGVPAPGATPVGGRLQGPQVTPWFTPSSVGSLDVLFVSNGSNCCPTETGGLDCNSVTCAQAPDYPYAGISVQSCEYQRYQTGAQPFWTPMRYPGQYYDAETDLFENWNRYYDPSSGRYLQSEPMASLEPKAGAWPAYVYAHDNPIANSDPAGLYKVGAEPSCQNWYAALRKAKEMAGCGDNGEECDPDNSCQKAVMACAGGCNICKILAPGQGPTMIFEDRGQIIVGPDGVSGLRGHVGRDFISGEWAGWFNSNLCADPAMIDVLASTMVHEAMHACGMINGPNDYIRDSPYSGYWGGAIAPGCTASELERVCSNGKVYSAPIRKR
ncbi:RHS repeat-associated core domain-containing protein [Corallococcus macrosporus]|uniref:RHS repeat-associated core domain-containing protein n=1 Tax=Corallococcus macrosporus TaxID=35 RepID=UPI0009E57D19|nr:RHS repeat-associated core domain-containing protein [Corallococcus macrosporus]